MSTASAAWTVPEQGLIECVRDGTAFNARGAEVSARFVRDLMLRPHGQDGLVPLDPRGVRLHNAVLRGTLDLESAVSSRALELRSCVLDSPLILTGVRLPRLVLSGSRIVVSRGPAVSADGMDVAGDVMLDDHFEAESSESAGAVRLRAARIGGRLSLRMARLTGRSGPALDAERVTVGGDVLLDVGFTASVRGGSAAVRLTGGEIGGHLSLRRARLSGADGPALHADRLSVGGDVVLDDLFEINAASENGAARFVASHIRGQLVLGAGTVANSAGAALFADRLTCESGLRMHRGFTAVGAGRDGAVRLIDATLGSQLIAESASLANASGPALNADRLVVEGDLVLGEGFRAEGRGAEGCARLVAASIRGQLRAEGASLVNREGPALAADTLQVTGDVLFRENVTVRAEDSAGAIRLPGSHIGGQLTIRHTSVANELGPALFGETLNIGGDLLIGPGLVASGTGEAGVLRLTGATVGGRLSLLDTTVTEPPSAGAPPDQGLRVLVLDDASLRSLRIDPVWFAALRTSTGRTALISLDGTTYTAIPAIGSVGDWIKLLRASTERYAAQPYQQLAAVYSAGGRDQDARRILIAQRDDRRVRGLFPTGAHRSLPVTAAWRVQQGGLWIQKVTIGYGYRTWPAFLTTLLLAVASAGVGWSAGHTRVPAQHRFALYEAAATGVSGSPSCGTEEQLAYGIRAPFLADPDRGSCTLDTGSDTGEVYAALFWALTSLTWASATLAAAGYTGLVRRP